MSDYTIVKHRKNISEGQLAVLRLLYKYRFGSIELLRISLGLNEGPGLYKKLEILIAQGYVGKRFESSYRIKGIPAAYYLKPSGLKVLQALPEYSISDSLIKYSYSDKRRSLVHITHCLQVYGALSKLHRLYPGLRVFTKRELAGQKHFPEELPDALVSLKLEGKTKPYRWFLDILADWTPRHKLDKKVAGYDEFFDNEDNYWGTSHHPLPVMLLLCESGTFERRVQRLVSRKLQGAEVNELKYYTSTLKALKHADAASVEIWSGVEDPEEIHDLMATQTVNS